MYSKVYEYEKCIEQKIIYPNPNTVTYFEQNGKQRHLKNEMTKEI